MSCNWMRRALLALAATSALFVAGCGSGTIESQFRPTRSIAFGDGFSDLGSPAGRYTVNDGSSNIWSQQLALNYGVFLVPDSAGGNSYAKKNARVNSTPDAAGSSATPTVTQQIDTFLATGAFTGNDLVIISAGISDVIAETAQLNAGTQTSAQMMADVQKAGRDLGAQVRRLVQAGAQHVVLTGTYDLSRSPWAAATGQGALLTEASTKFNTELLVSIVDLGANVLYIDTALLFNLMSSSPVSYGLVNAANPTCNSVDPGPGIGIGAGEVNSALCTTSTITSGVVYSAYMFADKVYPTPQAHRILGDYAYQRTSGRW